MPKRNNHNVFFLFKNSNRSNIQAKKYAQVVNVSLKTFECRGPLNALIKPTGPFLPDL